MTRKRQTIGVNPLDALVPSAVTAPKTSQEGPQPASEPERPEQVVKEALPGSETLAAATVAQIEEGEQKATSAGAIRKLRRENKELLARVKELELERVAGTKAEGEGTPENYEDVSEESSSIISNIRNLEEQLDAAFALTEAQEADLDAARKRLSEESATRAELEARVESLRAQAALEDQLREDIAYVEQERDASTARITEIAAQLERISEDRDSLAEQLGITKKRIEELQQDKIEFEAQVLTLKDKVATMAQLRKELDKATDARQALAEEMLDLKNRLEVSETSKNALESDLASTREVVRGLEKETEDLHEKLNATNIGLADMLTRLEEQKTKNDDLAEANKGLEREMRSLTSRHESTQKELEAAKKALRKIHAAAAETTGRARQRYYKPSGKD